MIDKELMVLEAKKRGLDQRADFRRKMDKLHSDRVLRHFLQLEVYDKIVHTQEELLAHQRETGPRPRRAGAAHRSCHNTRGASNQGGLGGR